MSTLRARPGEDRRDSLEYRVPHRVTVGIVDVLEVVDVRQDDGKLLPGALRQRVQLLESLLHGAVVGQPSEAVRGGPQPPWTRTSEHSAS